MGTDRFIFLLTICLFTICIIIQLTDKIRTHTANFSPFSCYKKWS